MSFNKKHYNDVKKFTDYSLNNIDFRLAEKYKDKPGEWAVLFLPHISDCVRLEDYEGAKAVSDSIRDFLNKFLDIDNQIKSDELLNFPEYRKVEIQGIICFTDGTAQRIQDIIK